MNIRNALRLILAEWILDEDDLEEAVEQIIELFGEERDDGR